MERNEYSGSSEGLRNQESEADSAEARSRFSWKYLVIGIVILLVSLIAALLIPDDRQSQGTGIVSQAARVADRLNPSYESSDSQLLTEFIREQFEWDCSAPMISGSVLRGVSINEVDAGVELPVFIYEDAHGGQIVVYAVNYRVLDEQVDNLGIPDSVLKKLSEEYQLVVTSSEEGSQAVLWREYSFVFLAVSTNESPNLATRINPKRSP